MAVLKAHNSILKANGKILKKNNFIFLNNFDNISDDNHYIRSLVGEDLYSSSSEKLVDLVPSEVFAGENCIQINSIIAKTEFITPVFSISPNIFTFECYLSNVGSYSYNSISEVCGIGINFEIFQTHNKFRLEFDKRIFSNFQIFNNRISFVVQTSNFVYYWNNVVNVYTPCHYAVVYDLEINKAYLFINGLLALTMNITQNFSRTTFFGFRKEYADLNVVGNNFISLRKGDFSNNRQTFVVPTSRYTK